jgi:tRNA A-37 threonylcarbamoyl transferase component Bud32
MQFEQIGKYRVLGKIGHGAMGEVFRAHDAALDREVAIKVITAKLSGDEEARKRFVREAKAVAALNHPNIITVYDFGEHQGMAFMVMEMLDEGRDLKELIEKKQLPPLEIRVAIMEQICDGLAFAHRKGVIHQDIKPGNIRILRNGGVKVLDFGLAQRKDDTAAGKVMGTPYYMAPEQIRGHRPSARSDIFSLGAVFYEFLSGHRPFTGSDVKAILTAVVQKPAVPLTKLVPDISPAVSAFVDLALAKDPARRYADGDQMLEALRAAWLDEQPPEVVLKPKDTRPARQLGQALSESPSTGRELQGALGEIDQYLADIVPPLFVTDAVDALQGAPVEGTAAELWNWSQNQIRAHPEYDRVNVLFYALDKLMAVGMLNLLPRDPLLGFLKQVGEALAQACAPEERERLRRALEYLGKEDSAPQVLMLGRGDDDEGPSTPQSRRLSILEQRLRREGLAKAPANDPVRRRVIAQALAAAATGARKDKDFARDLRRLRAAGVGLAPGAAFKNLGNGLGNWVLPREVGRDTADLGPPVEVEAMERIVSLAEDPVEAGRRYHHLVTAATELFNEGNLGGAVQMFDLARKLADEEEIEPGYIAPIRGRGHEQLDNDKLRSYMEQPERHSQLRQVMVFFGPGLGVGTLLDQVEVEERRDRRRLLLDLLVIHGHAAREEAMVRLRSSVEKEVSDFGRRNWIYLLRLVPPSTSEEIEAEVEVVSRFAGPGMPIFLVKEALTHLGLLHHTSSARALVTLLERWESYLLRGDLEPENQENGIAALDRRAAAPARHGSARPWEALIDHAFSGEAAFGAASRRLEELGSQDLSRAPHVVGRLRDEIENSLPRGVLGRLIHRRDKDLPYLVTALSGTRSPEVDELLEEVADRYEGQEAGKAATRVLKTPPPAGPLAGLTGKLDTYGVPALLEHLARETATGTLTLRPAEAGGALARVAFRKGRPVAAAWPPREGLSALYQLFQQPLDASYSFDTARPRIATGAPALPEVSDLIREGLRRARELERTRALLPDDTPLEATGSAPSTVPDEPDYDLVVSLWEKACAGVPVRQIAEGLTLDTFRSHNALGHWLEEGALRVKASGAPPAAAPEAESPGPGT